MPRTRTPSRSGRRGRSLSAEQRAERRERDRQRLTEATERLLTSEGWQRWVRVRRQNGLARYSPNNQLLVALEGWIRGIEPSYAAGYRWWAEHGYQVRRGERALSVLAPIRRKVADEESGEEGVRVVGFRGVAVFDRSQVEAGPDAAPLEPPSEPLTGSSHEQLLAPLEAFAQTIGCRVSYSEQMPRSAGGFYRHSDRLVAVRRGEPNAMVRTLLHELAHALVAAEREEAEEAAASLSRAKEECVVECTGHIAAASAGLDTSGEAIPYCASWGEGGELVVVAGAAELIDRPARRLETVIADVEVESGEEEGARAQADRAHPGTPSAC